MKKTIAMLLALVMVFALCACGGSSAPAATQAPAAEAPAAEAPAAEGSVYWLNFKPESDQALQELAAMLARKEAELGRRLYLISDEPYRELTYGVQVPFVPALYDRTIICYSWSKSLSLPGERIGYVYVSDAMDNAAEVSTAIAGAGRALSFVCAPALFQRVIEKCIDEPTDVEAYRVNREILSNGLKELGYEYIEPDGAFYLWVKALEPDALAFSERAKQFELLIVPSNGFGCEGWCRLSYCVSKDTIVNSLPAFKERKESYGN